jgi:Trp operon repressor
MKENIESLSSKVERLQLGWRRSKVLELSSQGHSQPEIADTLQVSVGTVNRDLSYLKEQAKSNIKRYIDEKLPEEYEKCLVGLNSILREAWSTAQQSHEKKREKIQALSLAKECYAMKLELLTNATVVDDAIRFVSSKQEEQLSVAEGRAKVNSGNASIEDSSSDIQGFKEEDKQQHFRSTTNNQTF